MSKYSASGIQGQFESGSNELVLKNKLGIILPEEMGDAETLLLKKLYDYVFQSQLPQELTIQLIKTWHRKWLGPIYEWAGQFRAVNLSKENFVFANAELIPKLMLNMEVNYFSRFSELQNLDSQALVSYMAETHVEFILIHPFREGNGRLSRLILDVIAVKAGYYPMDYSLWDENKDYYFKSIQAGLSGNINHMKRLVKDILV
ncbi:hypothetical protein GCM10011365_08460 [Marinicella pacifica]|uniref:Fido domain-containing protein n=1 Tax=Marinicella pacifica TaxID=1171543 RepID=A0A917CKW7_9GAMM|nr:Fic family protein [Marinicella pacifica]GGF89595.1 hypothetical protein GCM10011365_08460 [Marinicella pacifica]